MSDAGSGGYPPPPGWMGPPPGDVTAPPPNYLIWAVLTTLFCCLPLGIPSIVFATQVNSKWRMRDYAGARAASTKAKQFAIWAAVLGFVVTVGLFTQNYPNR